MDFSALIGSYPELGAWFCVTSFIHFCGESLKMLLKLPNPASYFFCLFFSHFFSFFHFFIVDAVFDSVWGL